MHANLADPLYAPSPQPLNVYVKSFSILCVVYNTNVLKFLFSIFSFFFFGWIDISTGNMIRTYRYVIEIAFIRGCSLPYSICFRLPSANIITFICQQYQIRNIFHYSQSLRRFESSWNLLNQFECKSIEIAKSSSRSYMNIQAVYSKRIYFQIISIHLGCS